MFDSGEGPSMTISTGKFPSCLRAYRCRSFFAKRLRQTHLDTVCSHSCCHHITDATVNLCSVLGDFENGFIRPCSKSISNITSYIASFSAKTRSLNTNQVQGASNRRPSHCLEAVILVYTFPKSATTAFRC